MQKTLILSLLLASTSLWAAPVQVLSSFSILGNVTQELGGERVQVQTLIGANQDVHTYQLQSQDVKKIQAAKLIVAYEPVWAIGTGMVATPQSAQDAANAIRNDLKTTFGTKVSDSVRILYGGSVTSKNAAELISQPDVDGFLIGGAALDVEELAKIARLALKSTKSRN